MNLMLIGDEISGDFSVGDQLYGSVTGAVSGGEVTFTVKQDTPCPGAFEGKGYLNAQSGELSGTYSGEDCNGTLNANYVAKREKTPEGV